MAEKKDQPVETVGGRGKQRTGQQAAVPVK